MTEQEIIAVGVDGRGHPAWRSFVTAMRAMIYGPGPTRTAWAWFLAGWEQAVEACARDY